MSRLFVVATLFALGGCAPPSVVTGPAMPSPGPEASQYATEWHRDALGEVPRWVQVNRPIRHMLGFGCSGGRSRLFAKLDRIGQAAWAQEDTFVGERKPESPAAESSVCVFHPFPNTVVENVLSHPRRLPSGALEGELWEDGAKQSDGAVFLLEAGVIIVARGNAVPRVRAKVGSSATPPTPMPIATQVHQWTYSVSDGRSLHWLFFNGASLSVRPHESESDARSDLDGQAGKRAWLHGTDLYVYKPSR